MKKLFSSIALIAIMLFCSVSFASVGVNLNGSPLGAATDVNVVCGSGTLSTPLQGSLLNLSCSPNLATSGIANGGATSMATSDTAVPTSYAFVRAASANDPAFVNKTLANGIPGQVLTFFLASKGSQNLTITPATATGITSVTLTAAKAEVVFMYINDTIGWILSMYSANVTVNIP